MNEIITSDFRETQQIGFDFAEKLHGGEVLALYGDLGSGKTTFMQGLAKGLGITKNIISPTFIIMRSYKILRHAGKQKVHLFEPEPQSRRPGSGEMKGSWSSQDDSLDVRNLYHVDLYRIESEKDVEGLGLMELMNQPDTIVAIEWPDKIENLLPEKRVNIYFEYLGEEKRKIRISQ